VTTNLASFPGNNPSPVISTFLVLSWWWTCWQPSDETFSSFLLYMYLLHQDNHELILFYTTHI
jgi:hypothetical protein